MISVVPSGSSSRERPSTPPPPRIVYPPEQASETEDRDGDDNDDNNFNAPRRFGTVLMLHGWAQNTTVFAQRTKKLTKRLVKNGYQVILLQAPHRLPPKQKNDDGRHQDQHQDDGTLDEKVGLSREFAYAWFLYDEEDDDSDDNNNHQKAGDSDCMNDNGTRNPKPSSTGTYRGMEESLELVRSEIINIESKLHPIHLLGFSQGAVLAHKITTLVCKEWHTSDVSLSSTQPKPQSQPHPSLSSGWMSIEKCIFVSGFPFQRLVDQRGNYKQGRDQDSYCTLSCHDKVGTFNFDEHHQHVSSLSVSNFPSTTFTNASKLSIPTLHVIGAMDVRVHPELSYQLVHKCGFVQPKVWKHDRGHVVPQDMNFCQYVIDFLSVGN